MRDIDKAAIAIEYAKKFIGTPYLWGGDDPMTGFDCSGFIIETLKAVGILKETYDSSAHNLFNHFKALGQTVPPTSISTGYLLFFGTKSKISHVAIAISKDFQLEAAGGNSYTTSTASAAAINAFVKIRPINNRKDLVATVDPFLIKST